MKRILLQRAFVLHRRPYRETSFLLELFTPEYGRLTVVAKGVRKAKASLQGLLQSFIPLLVSWSGNGELMTLIHAEAQGEIKPLRGECLFAGFYLNELLICLLQKWDAHPDLYRVYEKTITELQLTLEQKTLRSFEKYLLEELGYGLWPKTEAALHQTFAPHQYYRFMPEQGFMPIERESYLENSHTLVNIFSGKNLLAIAKEEWHNESVLQDAKRLTRLLLIPLLNGRTIHSRRLFQ